MGCAKQNSKIRVVTIDEVYQTQRDEADNIDSPAIWHGPNSENWVIATAKEGNVLVVYDAATGDVIKRFGQTGIKEGQFSRPNGIFIIDNLALIVERDNQRVQVLALPDFRCLGFIGDTVLIKPYGLFVYPAERGHYNLYVTDNYETIDEKVPTDSLLGKRIHQFDFSIHHKKINWKHIRQFGATQGIGVLKVVESIWGDVANNRLLIAEEDTMQSSVKVYDLEGNFSGIVFGRGVFKHQVEGIALFETGPQTGYWIVTDQSYDENQFHLFDRTTFKHLVTLQSPNTTNTDGIWLSTTPFSQFHQGIFAAIHNDGNVSVFDWGEIVNRIGL